MFHIDFLCTIVNGRLSVTIADLCCMVCFDKDFSVKVCIQEHRFRSTNIFSVKL